MSRIGQRRIFPKEEDFLNKFKEYLDVCELKEELANIAGFCWYAEMGRSTFYEQKAFYPDTFNRINAVLEDRALNNKTVYPTVLALYLKNKCDYVEKVESRNENTNKNIDASALTDEQINKILGDE